MDDPNPSANPDSPQFIVAEVATNWPKPWPVPSAELLSAKFEAIIETNRERGYRLLSWQLSRVMISADELNETIVAVFERAT